jgi:GMP synthase-like glutamine amidotransferase
MIAARRWHLVQHVPFEGPGLIATIAAERGLELEVCRLYHGDPLPSIGELAGLVVMGGPMSVRENIRHPYLLAESRLVASALTAQLPVLGVCLGAQLMAHALGAPVYPGKSQEIGIGTVTLTGEGVRDAVLGAPGQRELRVVHWHGETFDLPPGALWLAASDLYHHQAFRVGRCAYGFQFHLEVDRQLAKQWRMHLPPGIDLRAADLTPMEVTARSVLGAFFDAASGSSEAGYRARQSASSPSGVR